MTETTFVSNNTLVNKLGHALDEDVDQVAVGAGQQPGRHLDDGDGAAERGVDAAEPSPM